MTERCNCELSRTARCRSERCKCELAQCELRKIAKWQNVEMWKYVRLHNCRAL